MVHLVLLGDSIFDNHAYVAPAPDVVHQLRARLPKGARATLLAVDGHVTSDVCERQLQRLPGDVTHLVVSVGGNDALGCSGVLGAPVGTVAEGVAMLDRARSDFRADYRRMADALVALRLPAAVCTIYDANYPQPQGGIVAAALSLFNDIITREAFARGLDLIDLRLICGSPEDYANPIEPSAAGGEKISSAIAAFLAGARREDRTTVWAGG